MTVTAPGDTRLISHQQPRSYRRLSVQRPNSGLSQSPLAGRGMQDAPLPGS